MKTAHEHLTAVNKRYEQELANTQGNSNQAYVNTIHNFDDVMRLNREYPDRGHGGRSHRFNVPKKTDMTTTTSSNSSSETENQVKVTYNNSEGYIESNMYAPTEYQPNMVVIEIR